MKQYFQKIKSLESEPEKRTMTLDKGAAGRFIKHGLVSNALTNMRDMRLILYRLAMINMT